MGWNKENSSYYSYRLFHFMLLAFIAFHMVISSPGWTEIDNSFLSPSNNFFLAANILVIVFLIISLLKPDKIGFLILTLFFLTSVKLDALPAIPNHFILALIIFFTFFCSLLFYWDKNLDVQARLGKWYVKTVPYLRVELLIMYFFVVLHKANYGFFNPDVSCGAEFYADIAGLYPFLPTGSNWIRWFSIFGSFGLELIIPVLLCFPATRVFGVFTGLIFHFFLSLHPNLYILSFSAELYALYVLFLPKDLIIKIWRQSTKLIEAVDLKKSALYLSLLLFFGLSIYFVLGRDAAFMEQLKNIFGLIQIVWIGWALFLIIWFAILAYPWFFRSLKMPHFFSIRGNLLLIFPFLVFFNGLTPYIGLKTSTNFAMFSNLKVNGPINNHWFMPSHFQVADFQNDTVILISSSHPFLKGFIRRNERITFFQLKKFLFTHKNEGIHLTYKRNNNLHSITLPANLAKMGITAPSWLAAKFLIFKGIPIEGPTPCQW